MSSRRFQDVFKTSSKTSSRRLQDVFKTCLQDVLQLCLQDVLEDKKMLHWRLLQYVFTKTNVCWDISVRSWYEAIGKRHIQNSLEHLRWNVFPKQLRLLHVNCFHKTLHLRYLTGHWIHLWLFINTAIARISCFILAECYFLKSQLTQY